MPQTGSSLGAMGRVSVMATSCPVLRILSGAPAMVTGNGPPDEFRGRSNGDTMNDEFSIMPGPVATVARPAGRAQLARIGLLGIAAAALIAAAMLVFGAGASPTGTLAAGTEGSSRGTVGTTEILNGFRGGPGGFGFGHGPGRGITITAISGSDLSLETADGWTRTITVDDGTTYSESGDEIT